MSNPKFQIGDLVRRPSDELRRFYRIKSCNRYIRPNFQLDAAIVDSAERSRQSTQGPRLTASSNAGIPPQHLTYTAPASGTYTTSAIYASIGERIPLDADTHGSYMTYALEPLEEHKQGSFQIPAYWQPHLALIEEDDIVAATSLEELIYG